MLTVPGDVPLVEEDDIRQLLDAYRDALRRDARAFIIVPAQTLMQQETPHAMVGRVSSSFLSLISVAQVTSAGASSPACRARR